MSYFPFLNGEKVYLSPLDSEDGVHLLCWSNDYEVMKYMGRNYKSFNLEQQKEEIDYWNSNSDACYLGIIEKQNDRLIGTTSFTNMDHQNKHAAFVLMIGDKQQWNKGFGTETTFLMTKYGFEILNLNKIWLHVESNNLGAIQIYKKIGFVEEGRLRQQIFREGGYKDMICMSILSSEYKEKRR